MISCDIAENHFFGIIIYMIDYLPLARTLRNKSMTFADLQKGLGKQGGSLKNSMNTGKYISTDTVVEICRYLQCEISDVISWRDGKQVGYGASPIADVDYEKLKNAITSRGFSLREISLSLGKSADYLFSKIKQQSKVKLTELKVLCSKINCDISEVLK